MLILSKFRILLTEKMPFLCHFWDYGILLKKYCRRAQIKKIPGVYKVEA
jgi:hypothetical protein